MDTIKVGTSQNVAIDYPVAGLGERIAARLIDLAVFFGVYILFIIIGLIAAFSRAGILFTILLWSYVASYVFYNLLFEIFMSGQSIGKRIMKIKVISLNGQQASIGQYFIRWLFRLVDFVLTAQVGGLVSIAVTDNKQRIGDIVAGTTVIKTVTPTKMEHIAFNPSEIAEQYEPLFGSVHVLTDRDIELIHEVIITFYKTHNYELIEKMAVKITDSTGIVRPAGMGGIDFLQTIVKDYNYVTASTI